MLNLFGGAEEKPPVSGIAGDVKKASPPPPPPSKDPPQRSKTPVRQEAAAPTKKESSSLLSQSKPKQRAVQSRAKKKTDRPLKSLKPGEDADDQLSDNEDYGNREEASDRPSVEPGESWVHTLLIVACVVLGVTFCLLGPLMYLRNGQSDYTLTVPLRVTTNPIWRSPRANPTTRLLSNTPMPVDVVIWIAMGALMIRSALDIIFSQCCKHENQHSNEIRENKLRWISHVLVFTAVDLGMVMICGVVEFTTIWALTMLSASSHAMHIIFEDLVTGFSRFLVRLTLILVSSVMMFSVYAMALYTLDGIGYYTYPLFILIAQFSVNVASRILSIIQWSIEPVHTTDREELVVEDGCLDWCNFETAQTILELIIVIPFAILMFDKNQRPVS